MELNKEAQVEQLKAELLSESRRRFGEDTVIVFGDGSVHSRVVMIGEAPGEQESLQGRPFVGKAGKNLDHFLALTGLDRKDLYITNTVKLRPTAISKAGRVVNRPPQKTEIEFFLPYLKRELEVIRPEYVVTLGNVPLKALCGAASVIGSMHGRFYPQEAYTLFPIYHPASLIYNRSLTDVYAADLVAFQQALVRESV